MTQRIFDVENEKDMADLWDILPDDIIKLTPSKAFNYFYGWWNDCGNTTINMLKINWHNKTEITRPIQEATEQDVGKLCYFWNELEEYGCYGVLGYYKENMYILQKSLAIFDHCRRLTKQEIKELC